MARKPRVHYPGALYHVIARGNQGQTTFREAEDYRLYLKFLREYKEHFDFLLHAYVLMPTHIHLLIETGDINLSKVMHRLQFRYTRNFNLKYRTWGHLFQGRYKAIMCDRDMYFLELSAYIHLNPVRAGLVKNPANYPWSSYPSYLGREKNILLTSTTCSASFQTKKGQQEENMTFLLEIVLLKDIETIFMKRKINAS